MAARALNRTSRIAPLSPSGMPWMSTHVGFMGNQRPRRMDAADIADLLEWQAAGAQARHAGRIRHRVRVRRHGLSARTSSCCPNTITAPTPTAAASRIGCVWCASCSMSRARRSATLCGGVAHQPGGAARQARAATPAVGSARGREPARRLAGSLGREDGLEPHRLRAVALRPRGQSRAGDRFRQAADRQARGRRRPVHLARCDGLAGQARRPRSDRRRPALHRRSVPAEEDRRGAGARDPRVHRLQHLHLELARRRAGPLHPESHRGRGVAARLASGGVRAPGQRHRRY